MVRHRHRFGRRVIIYNDLLRQLKSPTLVHDPLLAHLIVQILTGHRTTRNKPLDRNNPTLQVNNTNKALSRTTVLRDNLTKWHRNLLPRLLSIAIQVNLHTNSRLLPRTGLIIDMAMVSTQPVKPRRQSPYTVLSLRTTKHSLDLYMEHQPPL